MIVEIKKGSKRLANLLLPIIKAIKCQLDMNRIFIFTVAVITLTLTACGNKTQGGGDNDIHCKQTLCRQMMRLSIQRNIYVNVFVRN